jgi:nitroreductase
MNPIIQTLLNRKSIRKYTKEKPSDEIIHEVVRAGQQAPFAAQLYSILLKRKGKLPFSAPLLFTICIDLNKMSTIMAMRSWTMITNDLFMLLFGAQDASLMGENMVIAAESLGMGSCYLGGAPYFADKIAKEYHLPPRVFPLVQLVMGYPAENPPPRPRYPLNFVLFEDTYPKFNDEQVQLAMQEMDMGYMEQGYYKRARYIIPLETDRPETFSYANYGWTEHISRKWGQWHRELEPLLEQFRKRGFNFQPPQEPPGN